MHMDTPHIAGLIFGKEPVTQEWLTSLWAAWGDASVPQGVSTMEPIIRRHYAQTPEAKDAYSRLACLFLDRGKELKTALRLFEQDAKAGRQTWFHTLRQAECTAALGNLDAALTMVEQVYKDHAEAVNGYAAIGRHLRKNGPLSETSYECEARDVREKRLSAGYKLNVAVLAIMDHRPEEARELIEQAYREQPSLTDGYARCAWQRFWPTKEYPHLLEWFEQDRRLDKLSPLWQLRLAQSYAESGKLDQVGALLTPLATTTWSSNSDIHLHATLLTQVGRIHEATEKMLTLYSRDNAIRDGLAGIAEKALQMGRISDALHLFQKEHEEGRLSPKVALKWARILLRTGHQDATATATAACSTDASLKPTWQAILQSHRTEPLPDIDRHVQRLFDSTDRDCREWIAYVRGQANVLRILHDFHSITRLCPSTSSIVDVGCVPPLLLSLLSDAGYTSLSALDPAADIFRGFFEDHDIQWASMGLDQPVPQHLRQSADLVCFCEVLEHLPGDLVPLIEKVCSIVKPGGLLFVTTPNLRSISGLYSLLCKHSGLASKPNETVRQQYARINTTLNYFGHLREYTTREAITLFESFDMKHEETIATPPYKHDTFTSKMIWWSERFIPSWRINQQLVFRKPA